jgi:hypothetical protein
MHLDGTSTHLKNRNAERLVYFKPQVLILYLFQYFPNLKKYTGVSGSQPYKRTPTPNCIRNSKLLTFEAHYDYALGANYVKNTYEFKMELRFHVDITTYFLCLMSSRK